MTSTRRSFACSVIAMSIVVTAARAAPAKTFPVTSTADAVDAAPGDGLCATASGECTLRAAIQEANALPGEDVIQIPAGTYHQDLAGPDEDDGATGDLDVTDDLVVDGDAATLTADADRVFDVHGAATVVTISGLTMQGRVADFGFGGAVRSEGVLTLTDCVVDGTACYGGGISSSGTLTTVRSTVSGAGGDLTCRGGGIFGTSVTVRDSMVSGQYVGTGGGISADDCTITNSTIGGIAKNNAGGLFCTTVHMTGSSAGGMSTDGVGGIVATSAVVSHSQLSGSTNGADCGGVSVGSLTMDHSTLTGASDHGVGAGCVQEGAIDASTIAGSTGGSVGGLAVVGAMTIVNSTISGNRATYQGVGGLLGGRIDLVNVTITDNHTTGDAAVGLPGGMRGDIHVRNSVVAGNVDDSGRAPDCFGTITSDGYDLIGDTRGCTIVGDTQTVISGVDPRLGELAGGPEPVHALLPGSPAIDAGNPAGCVDTTGAPVATDERGIARPQGGRCDLGAYEFSACGNGVLDPGEQCDHACTNGAPDSCCSALCQTASLEAPCAVLAETCVDATTTTSFTTTSTSSTTSTTGPDPVNLKRARFRPDGAGPRSTGSIVLHGDLTAAAPSRAFSPSAGLVVRVRDGLTLDQSVAWTAAQCATSKAGAITCKTADKGVTGSFRPVRSMPGLYRFVVIFRRLGIHGPFQASVTIDIARGDGQTWERTMAECVSRKHGFVCLGV